MVRPVAGRFSIAAYVAFLCLVALLGGASDFRAASQPLVRLGSLVLILILLWRPSDRPIAPYRSAFLFLATLAGLILVQLVPLPPAIWSALPGHAHYLAAAAAAGESQPWRPLNLTPDRGWNTLFALLPPAAALLAAGRVRMRDQGAVLTAFILIIMASAVIGLAQISAGEEDALRFYSAPPTGSAVGLFANRNHQALLLACGLPMLGLWADRARTDRAKAKIYGAVALVAALFLVLMLPTTGSRTGLLLMAPALPCAILFAWPAIRARMTGLSPRQRGIVALASVVTSSAMLAVAFTFSRAEAVRRLFAADPIDDDRIALLRPLMGMIRDFFPSGSGFGSFDPVYRGYEPFANLSVTFMNQAHDDFLQIVLEAGLPGLLLLLAFLAWWGIATARLWRRGDSESGALGRLGSVILLLIMLASITDYPVRTPLIMVLAVQAVAWMLLPPRSNGERGGVQPLPSAREHL